MEKKRVLMAMSGGIDSTVAAMLLLEQGYELVGVTYRTFDNISRGCMEKEKGCCSVVQCLFTFCCSCRGSRSPRSSRRLWT